MIRNIDYFADAFSKIKEIKNELSRVIIGREEAIDHILICLFSGGHLLFESAPGLAKSMMVEGLSKIVDIKHTRIQLTTDIMPQDITGYEMPIWGKEDFTTKKGPIFAGLVLADEFNRAPEKTQSGFVEAMQERQVSIGGQTYKLEEIFTLIATKNPIETGGTFQVAEAVLDRFVFNSFLTYPSPENEKKIAVSTEDFSKLNLRKVCSPEDVLPVRDFLKQPGFISSEHIMIDYIVRLAQASRPEQCRAYLSQSDAEYFVESVKFGLCSPRSTKAFVRAVCVYSFGILGEKMILPEHIKVLAPGFFRHRLILNEGAQYGGLTPDQMVEWLTDRVPIYA